MIRHYTLHHNDLQLLLSLIDSRSGSKVLSSVVCRHRVDEFFDVEARFVDYRPEWPVPPPEKDWTCLSTPRSITET